MPNYEHYEHHTFKPGVRVYVDPSIRQIHPEHRLAGKVVDVTVGPDYSQWLNPDELKLMDDIEPESGVPVFHDGKVHYIEEEYVRLHQ